MLVCEPFLPCERASSSSSVLRNNISSVGRQVVEFSVRMGSWGILDLLKSSCSESNSKLGSLILAYFCLHLSEIELNGLVGSWSWSLLM